ncbi:unnamed protein product, partial [Notodromas monacha]
MRDEFVGSTKKLKEWIENAESTLSANDPKSGVDYEKILNCIDEHKDFFSSDSEAKELLLKIQKIADKILPSMSSAHQEELSKQVENLRQSLENILNLSKTKRIRLEKEVSAWRDYLNILQRVQAVINKAEQDGKEPSAEIITVLALKEAKQLIDRSKTDYQ